MRISKWVDMGAEVDIDISVADIRGALAECFTEATEDRLDERPTVHDVALALNQIGGFFNALTDEHIGLLSIAQRKTVRDFLGRQAARFTAAIENTEVGP